MKQAQARQEARSSTVQRTAGRPAKANPVTTPEMAKKCAELLQKGHPASRALREAGFPPATVNLSSRGINSMIRAELMALGRKYMKLGRDLSPEDQEAMVRGRLAENLIIGTDKGAMSAKQLGADKRVAMWQADSQIGLVVLQAPQFKTMRQIGHKVPILPPIEDEEDDSR